MNAFVVKGLQNTVYVHSDILKFSQNSNFEIISNITSILIGFAFTQLLNIFVFLTKIILNVCSKAYKF